MHLELNIKDASIEFDESQLEKQDGRCSTHRLMGFDYEQLPFMCNLCHEYGQEIFDVQNKTNLSN